MEVEDVMFAVEDCVAVTFPPKLNELPSTFPPPSVHAPGEIPCECPESVDVVVAE
jgi:hypothetical protein